MCLFELWFSLGICPVVGLLGCRLIPFTFEVIKPRQSCAQSAFIRLHLHSWCGRGRETASPAQLKQDLLAVTLLSKCSSGLHNWHQQLNKFSNTAIRLMTLYPEQAFFPAPPIPSHPQLPPNCPQVTVRVAMTTRGSRGAGKTAGNTHG